MQCKCKAHINTEMTKSNTKAQVQVIHTTGKKLTTAFVFDLVISVLMCAAFFFPSLSPKTPKHCTSQTIPKFFPSSNFALDGKSESKCVDVNDWNFTSNFISRRI